MWFIYCNWKCSGMWFKEENKNSSKWHLLSLIVMVCCHYHFVKINTYQLWPCLALESQLAFTRTPERLIFSSVFSWSKSCDKAPPREHEIQWQCLPSFLRFMWSPGTFMKPQWSPRLSLPGNNSTWSRWPTKSPLTPCLLMCRGEFHGLFY